MSVLQLVVIGFLCGIGNIQCVPSMEDVKSVWSRYVKVSPGDVRYYGEYPADVAKACELDPLPPINEAPGWIKVAASTDDFLKSVGCGMCIEITGDGTPLESSTVGTPFKGTLKAVIVDICGSCKQGGFDLYIPGAGVYKSQFKAVPCPTLSGPHGNIKFRFRGSNPWYLKVQVRNTKVAIAGLEILHNNQWLCMKRGSNNHFLINNLGEIKFPIKVRLTSISNEQLESSIDKLEQDVDVSSTIQFSGFSTDSKPEDIKCYGQGGITQGVQSTTAAPLTNKPVDKQTTVGQATPTNSASTPAVSNPTTKITSSPSAGIKTNPSTGIKTSASSGTKKSPSSGIMAFCRGKKDGQYPDSANLSRFIMCSHGRTFKMNCPKPLLYNKDLKVCDWPVNVLKIL